MSNKGLILIADRDDLLLIPVTDLLRIEGYECNYVPNAATVIEILRCVKFDLLVIDINMFGSKTLEIINGLSFDAKELPIILVTDVPLSEEQIRTMKSSVTVYLGKPLCFDELLKQVKCSIEACQSQRFVLYQ